MRLGKIIVILLLATFTLAFVIGVARSETRALEKIVLLGLVVGCVVLAARVSASSGRCREAPSASLGSACRRGVVTYPVRRESAPIPVGV